MKLNRQKQLTAEQKAAIIRLAWADRISFEEIEKRCGMREAEVIVFMRRELKPGSFRRWRQRVSGRITKHRKWAKLRYEVDLNAP